MERATRLVLDLVEKAGKTMPDVRSVCVGLPAPVDSVSGQVGSEGILPGWRGVAVAKEMEGRLRAPVVLDNTANLAALGELKCGALQGVHHGVYIKVSHGVGAGLILGGELFRGSAGTAGEIGHLTIDENGPVCRCGNRGCLETFIGADALRDALATSHGADRAARHHRAGPRRRPRLPTRAGGRGASPGRGGRRPGQPASTPRSSSWADSCSKVGSVITEPMLAALERCAIPSAAASVTLRRPELDADADVVGALAVAEARQAAAEGLMVAIG